MGFSTNSSYGPYRELSTTQETSACVWDLDESNNHDELLDDGGFRKRLAQLVHQLSLSG
jgi:hypothetical protein